MKTNHKHLGCSRLSYRRTMAARSRKGGGTCREGSTVIGRLSALVAIARMEATGFKG
ncbi:hypothetical protein [Oryza sativa Japonica Group]|uniref:Uncharacterized protein n=1 Tax=Oryza sativa subsp. japonica TaxID=39947 RepID=Q5NA56_ORYSJ|nr:hypothetical protein [Oryza sativa Japonica Group]BAD81650.1 hypothetical protein [Oryza sativa Japonica Group]